MPSIGFVISQLNEGIDAESPELLSKWRISHDLHQSWFDSETPHPHVVYAGYDNPRILIQCGPWSCPEEHFHEFARSDEMAEYLHEFGDTLDLAGAFHLDLRWPDFPAEASFMTMGRYWVQPANKAAFERAFAAYWPTMLAYSGGRAASGWTIKGGWPDVVREDHSAHVGGVAGRKARLEDYMHDEDEDEDENAPLQYVCCLGWVDEAHLKRVNEESKLDVEHRTRDWDWSGLVDLVKLSQNMVYMNLKRVDYAK